MIYMQFIYLEVSVMKIGVVGSGAVGLNYGLRLLERELFSDEQPSPFKTHFVVRSDYDIIHENGVVLHCNDEDPVIFNAMQVSRRIFCSTHALRETEGLMDLIIIAVKGYSLNDSFLDSLAIISHTSTKYLIIVNGLGMEEKMAKRFDRKNIVGGISLIGCNRVYAQPANTGPLLVRNFKDHRLDIGHMDDDLGIVEEIYLLWQQTKIGHLVTKVPSLLAARWCKLCWNITFSGISVAMGGLTVDIVLQDPSLHELANLIMKDIFSVAKAHLLQQHYHKLLICTPSLASQSNPLSPEMLQSLAKDFANPLPDRDAHIERMWSSTVNLGAYKSSTVVDLIENKQMEIDNIFSIPLQIAQDLQKQFDQSLNFGHLSSIVFMVQSIARIQEHKRRLGVVWTPTGIFTSIPIVEQEEKQIEKCLCKQK